MTKTISLVLGFLTLITSGCASTRTYLAPTAEDRARWEEEQKARNEKAKESPLSGPFGEFLYFVGTIGQVFK